MSKKEFIDLLRFYLKSYPSSVINEIIMDYEEHFEVGVSMGKTEAQISKELGSPYDIANEYMSNEKASDKGFTVHKNKFEQYIKNEKIPSWALILIGIGLAIISPGILGLILGIMATIFALFVTFFALIFALGIIGLCFLVTLIPGTVLPNFINIPFIYPTPLINPVSQFFFGIAAIGFSIIFAYLGVQLIKWFILMIKKFIIWAKWELKKGGILK